MALTLTGYRTDSDPKGVPTAVPSQIMCSEFGTPEEVVSYIRSYNRMMLPGKSFLFSLTGNADSSGPGDDDGMAVATGVFFHILNNLGGQLTGILSDEHLSSCIPEDRYDRLVEAQNRIVEVLMYMGGESDVDPDDPGTAVTEVSA